MNEYVVITGASRGLGRAFAYELAQRKNNLLLVSLPHQDLVELGNHLAGEFNIEVQCFETDLSETANVMQLAKTINDRYRVFMLINNAGIGGSVKMTEVDASYIIRIIQVNVMATALLTHQLLPNLLKRPKGYILNVSSMAAFSPIGYKTVYPASKSFVHSFSRSLYEELKGTNVFVSVVNPGGMATNDDTSARIEKQGFLGKLTLLKPEKVARICINRIFRKDSVIWLTP